MADGDREAGPGGQTPEGPSAPAVNRVDMVVICRQCSLHGLAHCDNEARLGRQKQLHLQLHDEPRRSATTAIECAARGLGVAGRVLTQSDGQTAWARAPCPVLLFQVAVHPWSLLSSAWARTEAIGLLVSRGEHSRVAREEVE
eukprot:scaffold120663_cov36-Tisochrysis_lutea.AAC.4